VRDHLDDLDLLAYASGLRPSDGEVQAHLAACAACRQRQADLAKALSSLSYAVEKPPPWDIVKPPGWRGGVRPRWYLAPAAAALLLGFWAWPRMIWPAAPAGPVALWVLTAGQARWLAAVDAKTGSVELRFSRNTGWALLTADRLPAPPPGHVYEAWWIRGRQHVRAAVFLPDADGHAVVWMQSPSDFAGVKAVGITVEPAPGRDTPTGPRQFLGTL
jgi:hypothetical protein